MARLRDLLRALDFMLLASSEYLSLWILRSVIHVSTIKGKMQDSLPPHVCLTSYFQA